MTTSDWSLRHVPRLEETGGAPGPIYSCQLCGRNGSLDQLKGEDCPKRSGIARRINFEMAEAAVAGAPLCWIRRAGGSEPASTQTFTDPYTASVVARGLANMAKVRLEIVRENGTVAIAVDPEPG